MGTHKLLLPLGGKPMINLIVDELLSSSVDQVLVVVGPDSAAVRRALGGLPVHFVTNDESDGEMLLSVRCGLRALPPEAQAALVVLGDQPGIKAEVVSRLIQTFRDAGHGIIVPAWKGKRGHPFLIAKPYWDEILHSHSGQGLRGLLQVHADCVCELPVDSPGILEDMDLPADYHRISVHYS